VKLAVGATFAGAAMMYHRAVGASHHAVEDDGGAISPSQTTESEYASP
jgi:hypothetical protein